MASYFNLTLDTLAPQGLSIKLNNGALYTSKQSVALAIALSDADTTDYQIKIWGIDGAAAEDNAVWETFVSSKQINLIAGDGLKTVYVKVRDDVGNESAEATATITLDTTLATVTVTAPSRSRISKQTGYNTSVFNFTCSEAFTAYKVCVVPAVDSGESAGVTIGTANGSVNTSGAGQYEADTNIEVTINGADLEAASAGDGVKIIKVFVKDSAGNWSAA